jgi:hypothetical protein
MDESTEEDMGVTLALLERFQTQRLPRALALKERIDQGGLLDEFDIAFLETVFYLGKVPASGRGSAGIRNMNRWLRK